MNDTQFQNNMGFHAPKEQKNIYDPLNDGYCILHSHTPSPKENKMEPE